jgi:hypothetical protein
MQNTVVNRDGLKTDLHLIGSDLVAHTTQDCTPIAERMKAMSNAGVTGSSDMKFAGSIPEVFVIKYCNDNGITFSEFMQGKDHIRRLINDPALAHFRVWKGKV